MADCKGLEDISIKFQKKCINTIRFLAVEAGSPFGWERYTGIQGEIIGMDRIGASAPVKELFREFGFTVDNVVKGPERLLADS